MNNLGIAPKVVGLNSAMQAVDEVDTCGLVMDSLQWSWD